MERMTSTLNFTDLTLGWTVRWRTATGNKCCPISGHQHISQSSNLRRLHVATVRRLSAAVSREREFFLRVFVFKTPLF